MDREPVFVLVNVLRGAGTLVTTPGMFYLVRFVLGVFEAGFYPGIIFYLTY